MNPDPEVTSMSPLGFSSGTGMQKKKRLILKTILVVLAILVILGLVGGLAAYIGTKAPTDSARIFIQDMVSGDTEKAFQSTDPEFQKTIDFEQFKNAVQDVLGDFTEIADIRLSSRIIVNDTAEITGTVTEGEKGANILVQLKKTDGGWIVSGMKFSPISP